MFTGGIGIDPVHQLHGMLVAIDRVRLRTLGLGDTQGIAGLEKFQRQLRIQNHRIKLVACGNVAAAFQELVLGVQCFDGSLGIVADDVLEHDDVAGLADCKIRFRGDHQRKRLKIRGDINLAAMVVADQNLA